MAAALDFRTKSFMVLVTSTLCIVGNFQNSYALLYYLLCALPYAFLLLSGEVAMFVKGSLATLLCILLNEYALSRSTGLLNGLVLLITGIVLRMLPGLMMAYFALSTTSMSDLAQSLRLMHVPDVIVIPITVMFRFFYSLRDDYQHIRESMRMHNLNFRKGIRRPFLFFEYQIVPLLMCASKSADDVAISAMTRGMVAGGRRSSISKAKLGLADLAILLFYLALAVVCGGFGRA